MELWLGDVRFDVTHRAVVMGILNRTPDSFYDKGGYWGFDDFLAKADQLVADGADFLDVGGVKAGPGDEVAEEEELDRVVPAVVALHDRFDIPLSVDTWRAAVIEEAIVQGAVVGNDISGFADPDYLDVCARGGASVVATHIRLAPRVADPNPVYDDLVGEVCDFLADRAARAVSAGIPPERVMVDAGLDLGKTEPQSLELLRRSDALVALGHPVFLSASNKRFLAQLLDTDVRDVGAGTLAAHTLGVILGCRVLRAHDVRATRRAADVAAALLAGMSAPVHLVKGDDAVLVGDAVRKIVDDLVGDGDRSLLVDEVDDERFLAGDSAHISPLVDAAETPPFLTERRIVVGRHLARFTTAESVAPLVAYIADPLPSTSLVLVWDKGPRYTGRGAVPKSLADAIKKAGGVTIGTGVPANAKGRDAWMKEHLDDAPVRLDARAQKLLGLRLGEDLNRVGAILGVLESTYGRGATIGVEELEPFLGEAGGVPPWELTDAIAAGDIATALDRLQRMSGGGDRHALQIMATIHRHVAGLMQLDGAEVRSRDEAAELLGMAPFPAEKLMRLARSVGSERIRRQVLLVAQADLDLRGASEWPDELILEVLVARLARLSSTR